MKSWRPEVVYDGNMEWHGTMLRFPTRADAEGWAINFYESSRTILDWRVVESDAPANYAWVEGKLVTVR